MNLQKLLSVLSKQERNLKNLLKIGLEKKESLVSNNYEKLNLIISEEEKGLLAIQLTEENRLIIMQDLFSDYGIDNKRYKLEILVEKLSGKVDTKILMDIREYEKRIKNIITELTKINHLNMVLIQQSRSLINETIQAVINSSETRILDRKG